MSLDILNTLIDEVVAVQHVDMTEESTGGGGGLLMLFTPSLSIASGCIVSADGAQGGYNGYAGGGSAGPCA